MAGCKLLNSIKNGECGYKIGGIKRLYLANYDLATTYTLDADGVITAITTPSSGKIFQIEFAYNSASWSDSLTVVNNTQKYRTVSVNFQLSEINKAVLNEADSLSLGTFVAFIVDSNNRVFCLGRENGLNATSFNFESGSAEGDSTSFTTVLVGNERELARLVKDETVISSHVDNLVVINED
jgi:hypothetical protein